MLVVLDGDKISCETVYLYCTTNDFYFYVSNFPLLVYILPCYLASQEDDNNFLLFNMVNYLKHLLL